MRKKPILEVSLKWTFVAFLLSIALSFSSAYGGPEVLGVKPPAEIRALETIRISDNVAEAGVAEITGFAPTIPVEKTIIPLARGQVSSIQKESAPLRFASGFDSFNAAHQDQWTASFSETTGKVKVLYGTVSKRYENGPESVARGFLTDSHTLFGLKPDLSDLKTNRVNMTPHRDHVRLQQTYNGIPILGAFVLVHSNKIGQVTMVQNDYIQAIQVANEDRVAEQAANNSARSDLQSSLGKDAILSNAKVEKVIAPQKGSYYYAWKVSIPTKNPWGYWVYRINAETGEILYKGNEIRSLTGTTGTGTVYLNNANWHLGKTSSASLKYIYNTGYLFGAHADIYDNTGNDPISSNNKFLYNPLNATQKPWFDATQAYYQLNTIWDWWHQNVILKYGPSLPDYFYSLSVPAIVNVASLCNAYYTSDLGGSFSGIPGFVFGNEDSCAPVSEDLVDDEDVVRHEFTHAMMDWNGFDVQFSSDMNHYGRAMGEGNADWFAYLNVPKDPLMADVAWNWDPDGYLRNLANVRMYPQDVDEPTSGLPEEHYTGEIWSGYLYNLYQVLGTSALPYVYHSFFYFLPSGGYIDGESDFWDAMYAQIVAEADLTGKLTSSLKAWGTQTARGFNTYYRSPYCSSNYFFSGSSGCDNSAYVYWQIAKPYTITTPSNLLLTGDYHEYMIYAYASTQNLTVTVTAKPGTLLDPYIFLLDFSSDYLAISGPSTSTQASLTYPNLPGGYYVIWVTGTASYPAKGNYTFTLSLK